MIIEIGHFLLITALALSLYQAIVPAIGCVFHEDRVEKIGRPISLCVFFLVAGSFITLVYCYIHSDFSVLNIVQNGHSELPLLFKITALWSNHEGSMLLWVLILTFFSALIVIFGNNLPNRFLTLVLVFQAILVATFLAFILLTSNPFERLDPPAHQGLGLNPVLQDIGLALHPPLLYLGYAGFSVCFSFALAALFEGRIEREFGRNLFPWVLLAWLFLTAGIMMGSWWAYYELGWGGYWFWDPVENASLIPWLIGTALLHSTLVLEKRGQLKLWTLFLSLCSFSLCLLGTFLVRSGFLTSVHNFALSKERGIFILLMVVFLVGLAFLLLGLRAALLKKTGFFRPISREGILVFNNLFLMIAAISILFGTLYPFFMEFIFQERVSVGAPFFHVTFAMFMVPLLLILPFGPLLAWKKAFIFVALKRLWLAFALSLAIFVLILYQNGGKMLEAACGFALSAWVILGTVIGFVEKIKPSQFHFKGCFARISALPGRYWGAVLSHIGVGVTLLGIVSVAYFSKESTLIMKPGEAESIAGYHVYFAAYENGYGPNYQEKRFVFKITDSKETDAANGSKLIAAKRFFLLQTIQTTEVAMMWFGLSQFYITVSSYERDENFFLKNNQERALVKIVWKPLLFCIWLGGFLMMIGAILAIIGRKSRNLKSYE